jgi:hypothetical protein
MRIKSGVHPGILSSLDELFEITLGRSRVWNIVEGLQIDGQIGSASKATVSIQSRAYFLSAGTHVAHPLGLIIDENIAVAARVNKALGHRPARLRS